MTLANFECQCLHYSKVAICQHCQRYKACCVVTTQYCQGFGLFLKATFNIDVNQIHQGIEFVNKAPYKVGFKVFRIFRPRLQSLLCAENIFSAHFWMCPRKIYRIHNCPRNILEKTLFVESKNFQNAKH